MAFQQNDHEIATENIKTTSAVNSRQSPDSLTKEEKYSPNGMHVLKISLMTKNKLKEMYWSTVHGY